MVCERTRGRPGMAGIKDWRHAAARAGQRHPGRTGGGAGPDAAIAPAILTGRNLPGLDRQDGGIPRIPLPQMVAKCLPAGRSLIISHRISIVSSRCVEGRWFLGPGSIMANLAG